MKTLKQQIKNKKYILTLFTFIVLLFNTQIKAQDNTSISGNNYKLYREAVIKGNQSEAKQIKNEIEKNIPNENKFKTKSDKAEIFEPKSNEEFNSDWLTIDPTVHTGITNTFYGKQIDMKMGDDGNMYVAVNRSPAPGYSGRVDVYRSPDAGQSWISCGYFYNSTNFIYNQINLLVEMNSNSNNHDSVRIFVFFNRLDATNPHGPKQLVYLSWRSNGEALYGGIISETIFLYSFIGISALSDGALFNAGTYIGMVYVEASVHGDFHLNILRSVDMGSTWVRAHLGNYLGTSPSADFAFGDGYSTDNVWIALEHEDDISENHIRLIRTNWNPTPAHTITEITTEPYVLYKNPCLTIKQNYGPDSAIITVTKNGEPYYLATTNAGGTWNIDIPLGNVYNGDNKSFTYCASSSNGDKPFVAMWQSDDGDSINLQRGAIGNMGETIYKRNSVTSSPFIMPVCIVFTPNPNINKAAFIYAGDAGVNVYADQEFIPGELTLKVIPEGFYRSGVDKLKSSDIVTVYLRKISSPYLIKDSASATINDLTFTGVFHFYNIDAGDYYIAVKHRNSIETWSSGTIFMGEGETAAYDFTASASSAYGNNMKQINVSPVRFGIYSGDVDQNGAIDALDLGLTDNDVMNFVTGYVPTDVNGDMTVDAVDLSIIDNNAFNYVSRVTPPLSAAMNSISNTSSREVTLSQNYPNPFNPSTKISFNLPQESNVKLAIYDMTGREIATLVNNRLAAGNHQYDWNASSFASGVYFFKITAGSFSEVRKMNLIK